MRQQLFEQRLSFAQCRTTQIAAIEIKKIEGVKHETVAASFAQILLQGGEIGSPAIAFHDDFAVDQHRFHRQRLDSSCHGPAEFLRPVQPAAGQELELALIDARLQTIAVKFDFMQPAISVGRFRLERRERRMARKTA